MIRFKKQLALLLIFSFFISYLSPIKLFANETSNIIVSSNLSEFTQKDIVYDNIFENEVLEHGKENATLEWNPVEFSYKDGTNPATQYYLARRKIDPNNDNNTEGEYKWELRGNYETESIKVLNIYPKVGNGFQFWMEELQRSFPQIDLKIQPAQVSLETFNSRPHEYLYKNSDGNYNYDVVVFGFWDTNNHMDISKMTDEHNTPVSAYDTIQNYIDAGYGVVFGHDTVQYQGINPNFESLTENNSDIISVPQQESAWHYSDKIAVTQQSTFTTYPFDIVGQDLIIPMSHTVNTMPSEKSDVYMTFEKNYYPTPDDGPYYNYNIRGAKDDDGTYTYNGINYQADAYLMVDGNIAVIQTGHSSGQSNTAEQAVLANTIYALTQKRTSTKAVDRILDTNKPTAPIPTVVSGDTGKITFDADDNGTQYKYRVIAEPVGYGESVSKNWDLIASKLDDTSNTPFVIEDIGSDSSFYAVSDTKTTHEVFANVKGKIGTETDKKAFEYYIDTNPLGEKRDSESGTKFVDYGNAYEIASLYTGLGKDQYLHVWTYDNADNMSIDGPTKDTSNAITENGVTYSVNDGITNISLWLTIPNANATVEYKDINGNVLLPPTTSKEQIGSVFTPTRPAIEGYKFNSTTPSSSITIVADEAQNIVTHLYDKLLTKQIYAVKHDVNDVAGKPILIHEVSGAYGENFIVRVDAFNNYTFSDYYTIGDDPTKYPFDLVYPPTFTFTDELPIYLHYGINTGKVKVVIQRDNKDGTFTKLAETSEKVGVAGEEVIVTGAEIQSAYTLGDENCYVNSSILSQDVSIVPTKEETKEYILTLIPREKTVLYYGLDYDTGHFQILNNSPQVKVYDGTNKTVIVNSDGISPEWIPYGSGQKTLDFTAKDHHLTTLGYHKGTLPEIAQTYTYQTFYVNEADVNNLLGQTDVVTNTTNDELILNFPEFNDVSGLTGATGTVDFKLDTVLIKDELGNEKLFGNNADLPLSEIPNYLPNLDDSNNLVSSNYKIYVNYKPYCKVTYKEYVTETDATDSSGTNTLQGGHTYTELYGKSVAIESNKSTDLYELIETKENGTVISNFNNQTIADSYEKTIDTYYRPKTYDLLVKVLDNADLTHSYTAYNFIDVPVDKSTTFNVTAEKNDFTLQSIETAENTDKNFVNWDKNNSTITFNPNLTENVNTPYEIDLIYKHNATAVVTYAIFSHNGIEVKSSDVVNTFVGDELYYKVPEEHPENYEIAFAYIDGEIYHPKDGEDFTYIVSKTKEHLYIVYKEIPSLTVTTYVEPANTGLVYGNTNEDGSLKKYIAGQKVTLNAVANEGYVFKNWTLSPSNVVINSDNDTPLTHLALSFTMPETDVVATANFVEEHDYITNFPGMDTVPTSPDITLPVIPPDIGGGGGGSGGGNGGGGHTKPPIDPDITLPDISDLIDEKEDQEYRLYAPYIQGYPTGLVQPSSNITRAEVMQVIYNLYGRGTEPNLAVLNKFSDVGNSEWYSKAIAFAIEQNVVTGYKDGTFMPDKDITRAELAVIIAKLETNSTTPIKSTFNDIDSHWAKESIEKLYQNGIVSGYPDGTFKPNQSTIRSEFVKMVNNLINRPLTYYENVTFPDLPKSHWAYDDMMNAANGGIKPTEN